MPRIRTATASTANNNRPSASSTAATATGRSKKRVRPLDSSDDDGIFPGERSGKLTREYVAIRVVDPDPDESALT